MQIDKISFNDISIFHDEEEFSIFHKLNFTRTVGGKDWLRKFFTEPHNDISKILGTQRILRTLIDHTDDWPNEITNGTIIMMDRFLDYPVDAIPQNPNAFNAFTYKLIHAEDYSMVKFSVKHFADFYRGIKKLATHFESIELPNYFRIYIDRILQLLKEEPLRKLSETTAKDKFSPVQNLYFGHYLRGRYKTDSLELINIFSRLDAWFSMAVAVKTFHLSFPEFIESDRPSIEAKGLYHILLPQPVAYDIELNQQHNFIFLTGANMAGKSTLIKSVGSSVFLAHIGMGVPAQRMKLTLFDGLLSNINVVD
ncbi:MAG: DNA mismatch repair protein MutS, partial [Bacteroidetes bacterium]|nr:DNA mismatch repair protein MutS [Bacteroidota bacterium]